MKDDYRKGHDAGWDAYKKYANRTLIKFIEDNIYNFPAGKSVRIPLSRWIEFKNRLFAKKERK